ncbi:MAG: hypothetical protein KAJ88_00585 [Candidatus Aenigmarchaeota archaeon]|nr:hypothetical protein [Candidatus Aenigmarchaeota archaeon]
MDRNNSLIIFIVSSVLYIFFVMKSGFDFDFLLSPMSTIFTIFTSPGLGINWLFLFLGLIFFCLSLALFIIYAYDNPGDSLMLAGSAIVSVIIAVLHSFSIAGILFSLGLFIASVYIIHAVAQEKDKVKSPAIFTTSLKVSSVSLTIFNLAIALGVFIVLAGNSSYADNEISSMTSGMLGTNISDIESLPQQMVLQQREAAYENIEAIERSVLYGIYSETSDLTLSEKQKCFNAINSSMDEIDRNAKASIDLQLAQLSSDPQFRTIESTLNLLKYFRHYYPHLTSLTVFMMLGMVSMFMKFFVAVFARIIRAPSVAVPQSLPPAQQAPAPVYGRPTM